MNKDRRNQALVGMSDGIPMFRGKHSRSCVPMALRSANLPTSLSLKFRHIHLAALYPCEYWGESNEHKEWERVDRKPKSLIPLLFLLVDDLLHWQDGDYVEDTTLPRDHPDRNFLLRAILLYWCGDYPALAEVSGFVHACSKNGMCHWCELSARHDHDTNSRVYGGYFRWLVQGHTLRKGNTEKAPRPRIHMKVCNEAQANEDWTGADVHRPVTRTGVNRYSPLCALDLFNMVWDFMLDWMHTCMNFWKSRIIPTFKGERAPAPKSFPDLAKNIENYRQKAKLQKDKKIAHAAYAASHAMVTFTKPNMEIVDKRVKDLCGEQKWIPRTLVPFETIEGQRKPKAADWLQFQRTCVEYTFYKVVPEHGREAFFAMVDILNGITELTADYDPEADDQDAYLQDCVDMQRKVVKALTLFERDFPKSEMTPCIHWIIHAAGELVPRWNNVRNFWCFITERFVGWMKTFIKNRALALPNMVRVTHFCFRSLCIDVCGS